MLNITYLKFWKTKNLISYLLLPLSLIYFIISYIRKLFISPIKFNAKVICVGNISVGGIGKTQVVIMLAKLFTKENINFLIVTNGYKSTLKKAKKVSVGDDPTTVGDEAVLLKSYGEVIATKKIKDACDIITSLNPEVIILDDRMQNNSIYKDFTILCVDNIRMFGNNFLLPAGPLRETITQGLNKSDIIIFIGNIINSSCQTKLPCFNALIKPVDDMLDKEIEYFAFCGIGDPERFIKTLKKSGFKIVSYKFYDDHHNYDEGDLKYLQKQKSLHKAQLITTEKDYVKLKGKLDIKCLKINLELERSSEFKKLIYEKFLFLKTT